ncbi:MAG TPA: bifunctional phosphoribosylaminoimidazolecarboxamide formyltransferase/inosine monophosphate cyclohydrolase [Lachnospiraceae bacterium]|nr:bifunctional phosphoribosylaminoimidazolecarboxamide formyltransferase/inosine monophosphate cyclohydrolase [Lachnospiraceae bacterium]
MKALISVSDKTGITELAKELESLKCEIISTGGTCKKLREEGINAVEISELTGFPECLDGRVKTLHPVIHAGILAMRDNPEHLKQLSELGIEPIDIVIVNLYPFKETVLKDGVTRAEVVENIDIGGPTMLRAAAKNYQDVAVVTDPSDYRLLLKELKEDGRISPETRFYFMQKVFEHTANYDAMIAAWLRRERNDTDFPGTLTLTWEKLMDLRYGENPHQKAAFYREIGKKKGSLTDAVQLNGKELSFNNINDTNGALELLKEFSDPTVVACKHGNPCGVGSVRVYDGEDCPVDSEPTWEKAILKAWEKAYSADKISIYGGILVMNRNVTLELAKAIKPVFLEVLAAPGYDDDALLLLKEKKNLRILRLTDISEPQDRKALDIKKINGGIIVQSIDSELYEEDELKVVTKTKPSPKQLEDMRFGMRIVKYTKSNGIVIVKDTGSVGIGPGQVNRVWAARQCIDHARELIGGDVLSGAVLASDAFFPFADTVEAAHEAGITAIIQPGGSIRDQESIDKADEYGIAMVFTGMRHFRH